MFKKFRQVNNDHMMGELFHVTSKINTTNNLLILLNVILYITAWQSIELRLVVYIAIVIHLIWYVFTRYIAYRNEWDKFIGGTIWTNYRFLAILNTTYIVLVSIAIGYSVAQIM